MVVRYMGRRRMHENTTSLEHKGGKETGVVKPRTSTPDLGRLMVQQCVAHHLTKVQGTFICIEKHL